MKAKEGMIANSMCLVKQFTVMVVVGMSMSHDGQRVKEFQACMVAACRATKCPRNVPSSNANFGDTRLRVDLESI